MGVSNEIKRLKKVIYELARQARKAKCINCVKLCRSSVEELTKCRNNCIAAAEKVVKEKEKEL